MNRLWSVRVGFFQQLVKASRSHVTSGRQPKFLWTTSDAQTFLNGLMNYEKKGMPVGSATASSKGLELCQMKALLEALGDPQDSFDAIHVVGSKGKGSTAVFMSSALRACGYRVGSYTSPHLVDFTERITVGKGMDAEHISPHAWWKLVREHMGPLTNTKRKYPQLSFFETTTALALLYFQQQKVDIAVLEAGMGGARDATNVTPNSRFLLAIITSVGMEHVEALGGSLESIVKSKVGIARSGKPLVVSPQEESVSRLIEKEAVCNGAYPICQVEKDWSKIIAVDVSEGRCLGSAPAGQIFNVSARSKCCTMDLLQVRISLLGTHQVYNALTAICALHLLKTAYNMKISENGIREGFRTVSLPGRLQVLHPSSPLTMHIKRSRKPGLGSTHVLLDGAHTTDSVKLLNTTLKQAFPTSKLVYVVAMAKDKDHAGVLREILRMAPQGVVFTDVQVAGSTERAISSVELMNIFLKSSQGRPMTAAAVRSHEFSRTIERAAKMVNEIEQDVVVVFVGSFYLVGEALRWEIARGVRNKNHGMVS